MYRCTDIYIYKLYIYIYIYHCISIYVFLLFAAFSSLFWDRCQVSCLRVTLLVVDGIDRMEAEAMAAMAAT